jgi:protein-tyrosine phosphatase
MDFLLDNLAVATYHEAAAAPPDLTALLCVARERDLHMPERLYHKVPIVAGQALRSGPLGEAVAWIRDKAPGHKVVVFSGRGAGRAGAVAVAYLTLARGMALEDALALLEARHPGAPLPPGLAAAVAELRTRGLPPPDPL